MDTAQAPPPIEGVPGAVRGDPAPRHGGPLALLRFLRARGMLTPKYGLLALRLVWLKLRWGKRLVTDGLAFVGPGVTFEIARVDLAHDERNRRVHPPGGAVVDHGRAAGNGERRERP